MQQVNQQIEKLLCGLTALFSMCFFGIVLVSILVRRAGFSIDASIELSRLFFVWSCFMAAAITFRRKAHVGFSSLYDRLPLRWQGRFSLLVHGLILIFMELVLVQSTVVVLKLWPTRLPMLGISQSWLYLPLPICSVFMVLFVLECLQHDLRGSGRDSAP